MLYKKAIIKRIYELCNENDYSINKLAELSAIPTSTLADIMSDRSKNFSYLIIFKICKGLKIELNQFYDTEYFKIDKLDY